MGLKLLIAQIKKWMNPCFTPKPAPFSPSASPKPFCSSRSRFCCRLGRSPLTNWKVLELLHQGQLLGKHIDFVVVCFREPLQMKNYCRNYSYIMFLGIYFILLPLRDKVLRKQMFEGVHSILVMLLKPKLERIYIRRGFWELAIGWWLIILVLLTQCYCIPNSRGLVWSSRDWQGLSHLIPSDLYCLVISTLTEVEVVFLHAFP